MIRDLYNIEPVRQLLQQKGARVLAPNDLDHPKVSGGEIWLLNTGWERCHKLVIHLPTLYPDTLPGLFWPKSIPRTAIIPHVNHNGKICTLRDETDVNPHKGPEVLEALLLRARNVTEATYTREALIAEVESEISAYWSADGSTIHYLQSHLADENFALQEVPTFKHKKVLWKTLPLQSLSEVKKDGGVGFIVDVSMEQSLDLMQDPKVFVANSPEFRSSLETLCRTLCKRVQKSAYFDFFCSFRLETSKGMVQLFARCGDSGFKIRPRKSEILIRNILDIVTSRIRPFVAEDLGTIRLIKRSHGSSFVTSITQQKIVIVGCGSLGSMLADTLSRSGVRRFMLIDPDILKPENLARHLVSARYLYWNKADALAQFIRDRFQDSEILSIPNDVRDKETMHKIRQWDPDLIVFATGSSQVDLTMSSLVQQGQMATTCFAWAESNMTAGHIVLELPSHPLNKMHALHAENGLFANHLTDAASLEQETGCQTTFSPYSAVEMQQFSLVLGQRVITWLNKRPLSPEVLRWRPRNHEFDTFT